MKPTTLTKDQVLHILKVALYAAASAGIAKLIALAANDATLFGPLTPIVNVVLVTVQKLFTED